jgi:hypothetical protein
MDKPSILSLERWIIGDSLTNRFPVEISGDKRVNNLIQAIMTEGDDTLGDFMAKNVKLCKVRLAIVTMHTLPTCKGFHTDGWRPLG